MLSCTFGLETMHKGLNSWDQNSEFPLGYFMWPQTSHVSSSPFLLASSSPGTVKTAGTFRTAAPSTGPDKPSKIKTSRLRILSHSE